MVSCIFGVGKMSNLSKLEIVRNLNDSGPQLQIVTAMRTLEKITQQMSDELKLLPEAIAQEVAPLIELEERVKEISQAQTEAISATMGAKITNLSSQLDVLTSQITVLSDKMSILVKFSQNQYLG